MRASETSLLFPLLTAAQWRIDSSGRIRNVMLPRHEYAAHLDHVADRCLAATPARRRGLFWRCLLRHTEGTVVVYGSNNTVPTEDHGPRRHLLDALLDAGDLSGITAHDLLPMLQSPDVESRELAVRAPHLVDRAG